MENEFLQETELEFSELYGIILEDSASTSTSGPRGLAPETLTGAGRWPR